VYFYQQKASLQDLCGKLLNDDIGTLALFLSAACGCTIVNTTSFCYRQ